MNLEALLLCAKAEFLPTKLNSDMGSTQLRQGVDLTSTKRDFPPKGKMLNCYGLPRVSRYF